MIRTLHRQKGPPQLGATGPGDHGPFGPWPSDTDQHDDHDDTEE